VVISLARSVALIRRWSPVVPAEDGDRPEVVRASPLVSAASDGAEHAGSACLASSALEVLIRPAPSTMTRSVKAAESTPRWRPAAVMTTSAWRSRDCQHPDPPPRSPSPGFSQIGGLG
jgi:hypothetical protein